MYLTEKQKREIKIELLKHGLSVTKINTYIGGTRQFWSRALSGSVDMRISTILKLSRLLGLTTQRIGELFFDSSLFSDIKEVQ